MQRLNLNVNDIINNDDYLINLILNFLSIRRGKNEA